MISRSAHAIIHLNSNVRLWTAVILADAASIHARAMQILGAAGVSRRIPFWIASSAGFAIDKHPTDVGFEFAPAWQGILDTNQTWSGVTIHIDVDIADSRSPSAA